MADEFTATIPSLPDLLKELQKLPAEIQARVMKGASATGASVIRKEAILRAPDYAADGPTRPVAKGHPPPGTLKRSIYQVRMTQQCTPTREVFKVDVRQGKKASRKVNGRTVSVDAFYGSWVEYGHYTRVPLAMTKTAKAAGRALGVAKWVPAHPYMRPALETKSAEALEAMRDYIEKQLPLAGAAMKFITIT